MLRLLALVVGAAAALVVSTLALAIAGAAIADSTCTETGEGFFEIPCLDEVAKGGLIGGLLGLAGGIALARWIVRTWRRQWSSGDRQSPDDRQSP